MSIRQLLISERDGEEWRRRTRNTVNQLVRLVGGEDNTASRPESPANGTMFFDNTLGQPIWWRASDQMWIDATGTAV